MTHDEAWRRLPDLLEDRDDAGLLAHVRACADCQRQLFLLGRVDRMLHERASAGRSTRKRSLVRALLGATAVAAAAAVLLVLFLPPQARTHRFMLRTASGRLVGEAKLAGSDARNISLSLTARSLPVRHGDVFVLWAGDERSSLQVGHFMVDRSGGCRVRFNLPDTHDWRRLWVTEPGRPTHVVART
ncbi:MAG: hypothetical protein HOQ28_20610 [Thermoleophilia bacterium]|nr:hypothetical protein [Thermoleophilia bacterium]